MAANPLPSAEIRAQIAQAVFHQQRGAYADAERLLRAVLASDPHQPDALHYLGLLAYQTGRPEQAVELMQRSITEAPGNAAFYYNLAGVLQKLDRGQEAVPFYQRCLDLQHGNGDAWQGLAQTLHALGHPEDAVACLEHAAIYAPNHSGCWSVLSEIQDALGMLPEASAAARRASELSPGSPELRARLGAQLIKQARYDEARGILDQAIASAPRLAQAHYDRATLDAVLGNFETAVAGFETVLEIDPQFYSACFHLAAIRKIPAGDPMIGRLEAAAARNQWREPAEAIHVHFTLGRILEGQGKYAQAFAHFSAGNQARHTLLHYSAADQREVMQGLASLFDADYRQRMAGAAHTTHLPVFILGMSRSGTTLTEQILARHPQVRGGGELNFLHAALRRRLGRDYRLDYLAALHSLNAADLHDIGTQCLNEMQALDPAAARITDKMPSNFMVLGLLHTLYPQARIIHCRRDPLDNCVSLYTTLFETGHGFSSDLAELGGYYRMYTELMQHWRAILPPGVMLELDYEALVNDTENQARRLLQHCGLEWHPACLQVGELQRGIRTASLFQARQPVYRSAVGRWKHYERFLGPLKTALGIPN
ncbi:MAG: sulfotransferase [Gammaproteobacteria bacterium]|nr:sulfotransferase [Gammaproteobacteria bacterium]MDE2024606.1 sulfotransferase [Gammaproteobacteria bacterium]